MQESRIFHQNKAETLDGWIDKTRELNERAKIFLIDSFKQSDKTGKGYDSLTELHFSGGHLDNYEALKKGEAEFKMINVLYEDGEVAQIHIIVDSGGRDSNFTDVYISDRALKDFLNK